jgi:hypothetical protein
LFSEIPTGRARSRLGQVEDAGEGDDAGQRQRIRATERVIRLQTMTRRCPDTEVTTRGMADCNDVAEIEMAPQRQVTHGVNGQSHIREGIGVTPSRVPKPAVFDIPGRQAGGGQGLAGIIH